MNLKYIFVGCQKNVRSTEIVYVQAKANYSIVKMKDGREFLVATTLKRMAEKLEGCGFIRPHKSFLINTEYILKYESGILTLTNGLSCGCSRRKRQEMDLILSPSKRFVEKKALK
ncbi:LytTR family transcriptional regulator [Lacihabitans sp. CCS-44]|uniref:LytR/AlgR family response regulator transcription factor n=1 Tax=Lacihabitans sp. CCS-44 TaxID=2487331 RepID=UPI0020CDDC01|nr:LytTR family DNA-binding domain-containing protein [Lacihabitans sp. CCS-44]MCP9756654.1 LytTR family transcriptional regulator [Lacihabitans sp. CCS-44]